MTTILDIGHLLEFSPLVTETLMVFTYEPIKTNDLVFEVLEKAISLFSLKPTFFRKEVDQNYLKSVKSLKKFSFTCLGIKVTYTCYEN